MDEKWERNLWEVRCAKVRNFRIGDEERGGSQ